MQNGTSNMQQKKPLRARHSPDESPWHRSPVDSHVGRASKDAGQKYANLHAYPGARFLIQPGCLTARFTHLRHEETHGSLSFSLCLSFSSPGSLPYVTINETCLAYPA